MRSSGKCYADRLPKVAGEEFPEPPHCQRFLGHCIMMTDSAGCGKSGLADRTTARYMRHERASYRREASLSSLQLDCPVGELAREPFPV
jgi:hypothetical protein